MLTLETYEKDDIVFLQKSEGDSVYIVK
jgi:cGMP-dependent protein kinase